MSSRPRVGLIIATLALGAGLWAAAFALGRSERSSRSAAQEAERSARNSAFADAYRAAFPRGELQGYPQGRIAGEALGRAGGSRQVQLRAQLKLARHKLDLARRLRRERRAESPSPAPRRAPQARQRVARPHRVRRRHAARHARPGRCHTRLFGEGGEGEEAEGENEACTPTVRERAAPDSTGGTP
jgi:hypothetical protein